VQSTSNPPHPSSRRLSRAIRSASNRWPPLGNVSAVFRTTRIAETQPKRDQLALGAGRKERTNGERGGGGQCRRPLHNHAIEQLDRHSQSHPRPSYHSHHATASIHSYRSLRRCSCHNRRRVIRRSIELPSFQARNRIRVCCRGGRAGLGHGNG
jgi:hypothetical protein